jgi:hypothetical protein
MMGMRHEVQRRGLGRRCGMHVLEGSVTWEVSGCWVLQVSGCGVLRVSGMSGEVSGVSGEVSGVSGEVFDIVSCE